MHIRKETATDYEAVHSAAKCAFEDAEHADGNEQDLVNTLWKGDTSIPELSLVVEADGKIVGHIMFTRAMVDGKPVLVLALLSVLPECQRRGVGKALIQERHKITREPGYTHAIVLGSERYYLKSGYSPTEGSRVNAPFDVSNESSMACALDETDAKICGTTGYAPELDIE